MAKARVKLGANAPVRLSETAGEGLALLDAAPLGMLVLDEAGRTLYANAAFSAMTGHVLPLADDFAFLQTVHADHTTPVRLQLERLVRGEVETLRGEHRLMHADGGTLWVMLAASRLPGAEPRLIVQLTSIELQKKAEEALAYSESRWNFALEGARQGVWDHDIRTDTMFYSRMWRRMRGIPADEVVGKDHQKQWLSRVHPDDHVRVLHEIERQDRGDEDFEALEYREMTRDGRYIWILSRGRPVEWDADGNPVRTIGTDTDITYLKTIEQELASEKERLRITLDAMADGMIATDAQGNVVFLNPAAEALIGRRAEEIRGRPAQDVFCLRHEMTGLPIPCPVRRCLETHQTVRSDDDAQLLHADGALRDIRCMASPVTMPDGTLSGVVLVFQDVTQSRALQRELAHSAAHDPLTGLPNRAAFERGMAAAIATATSGTRSHGLVYIDLDRFKPVNDTAGHAAGDALLKQVARTIRECCRSHDVAARIGGDEFAVILEGCPPANARLIAEKIVRAIGSLIFTWSGRDYRIGASAGVTQISAEPASPLGFLGEADAACYSAKSAGRGRVVAFRDMLGPEQRRD